MGDQRPTKEIVRPQDVASLAKFVYEYRGTFGRLLPEHIDVDAYVGAAAGALYKAPKTAAAAMQHPDSLLVALRDCARLGHMPGTDEYALTVRGGAVLGIEQYQGVIDRMYRSGGVAAVHCDVVSRGDRFTNRQPPVHDADWFDRSTKVEDLIGVYAYAILTTGACSQVVVMGRAEVMRHRAVAATTAIWDGPFGVSMWKKTACHELEKWCPTSVEYRRELARVTAEAARLAREQPLVEEEPDAERDAMRADAIPGEVA